MVGMARFGDGLGADADLVLAAEQACAQALAPLGGVTPDLVCVFFCTPRPDDADAVAETVARLTGAKHVLGCSAGGVIGASQGLEQTSAVSVWAAVLPGATLRSFHLEVIRTVESLAVVGMPDPHEDDRLCLLLADPYSFPADGFVERSNATLGTLPIAGGLASGVGGAGSTRLVVDGRVVARGAVGVMLGGDVAARTVVSQGCRPIGPTMVVTAAEGNVILELAGMPALTKLEEVLNGLDADDQALASAGLHLGVVIDEYADTHERGDFLVRGVIGADRERTALVVGDLVEVGRTVRFQVRDASSADEDLRELLGVAREGLEHASAAGALLFSCNGRGAHLFASADHDVLAVQDVLSPIPVGGFFAAGEIGPIGGRNYLHGFTASVVAFS
jgi:small ligand-binding sensory domain FIST